MEKYNNIKETDKFKYLTGLFANIDILYDKLGDVSIVSETHQLLQEFAGFEYMNAIEFRKRFTIIEDYCEKFFDCKEHGFSYELGCRYKKIDFSFTQNIDGEISWLKGLLKIYRSDFVHEINTINNLIKDLEKFKPYFDEYLKS